MLLVNIVRKSGGLLMIGFFSGKKSMDAYESDVNGQLAPIIIALYNHHGV